MMYAFYGLAVLLLAQSAYGFAPRTNAITRGTSLKMAVPGQTSGVPKTVAATGAANMKNIAFPLVAAAVMLLPALAANAADAPAAAPVEEPKVDLGPPPSDFTLKQDYYRDCQQVVDHMRYAVQLDKTNPRLSEIAQKVKDEMSEFTAFYRRFQGISGRQSFSLLYTSINVLSGHYTSYGVKFPVPEKRRKRLLQEFNDIEKNIRKKR